MNYKNIEGYADPTAFYGTLPKVREEAEQETAITKIMHLYRDIASLAGFEIVNRITFRHKRSGKIFS